MKQLLLVTVLTCITTTAVCSDLTPDQVMEIEYFFGHLLTPPKPTHENTNVGPHSTFAHGQSLTFERVKSLCKMHPHAIKKAVNSKGLTPLTALLYGALYCYNTEEISPSVERFFAYPIFCEFLICGLNPNQKYVWIDPLTKEREIKKSFYEELEAHKDTSDVRLILAQTKALELWVQKHLATFN